MIGEYLAAAALGYALGSIPTGLLLGRLWLGRDIRELGSGKTGMTNVLRTAGPLPAVLGLVVDMAKGLAPALVGRFVLDDPAVAATGAGMAMVGHVWPVFAGFRGGRGVATAVGGLFALIPVYAAVFCAIGLLALGLTRIASVMSVAGAAAAAVIAAVAGLTGAMEPAYAWLTVGVVALIEYTHIPNIRRLLAGSEPRLGRGGDRPATG